MVAPQRRDFLKRVAFTGACAATAGRKLSGRELGANDTIRIAVAGLNGRGAAHVDEFSKLKGVEIAYLIDPDPRTFPARVKQIVSKGGKPPQLVADVRRALEDKRIDAVSIATPNHWHALMTIWACQAGKDVYVEKPCSHNVREGRIAVQAARRHGRIVQHGTGSRSSLEWARVVESIRSGQLGKLLVARGLCYKRRNSIGFQKASTPPAGLDFNLWLGPAAERSFHANLVHYNWHWFWDFGNGDIGNQGVHEMDVARWGIAGATLPRSVMSLGGRFGYSDQGETANTQIAVFDYGPTQLIFEVRGLPSKPFHGKAINAIFHLEAGTIAGTSFFPKGSDKPAPLPNVSAERGPGGNDHFANFIAAVRSRKAAQLNADILEGHYSSALCHLANISYRLGQEAPFHPRTRAFGDNKEAYETLVRLEEHLGADNGLKLEGHSYRLGRKLQFDARTESFIRDPQADAYLTRAYRQPFVVPDKLDT